MTALQSALEQYLSMRQGLGYKYQHQARRLADFVSFMEKRNATTITTKLVLIFAISLVAEPRELPAPRSYRNRLPL